VAPHLGALALPAVDQVLVPTPLPALVSAAGSLGYGVTESQSGEGAHHRAAGSLAATLAPFAHAPELAFSLAFDGRYDRHPEGDDGAVGLPRLSVFGAHTVSPQLQLGAVLSWAAYGERAPSLDLSAPVITALALGAYKIGGGSLLSLQIGFRLDESAHAAPDLQRLSPADRMALGLSDFHALPLGIAFIQRIASLELAAELSGELLLGGNAPSVLKSPLRAAVVARVALGSGLSLELLARLGLSQRPRYARVLPLIPVEPRFFAGLGLRFAPQVTVPPPPAPVAPRRSSLHGTLTDSEGAQLAAVRVALQLGADTYTVQTAEDGSFSLQDLPRGEAELRVTGDGLEPVAQAVLLDRPEVEVAVRVTRRAIGTQLRGLVRSFAGTPLPAKVRVLSAGSSVTADNDGRFVLELPPGVYQVEIECGGYLTQQRRVSVQENGVTVLNVELHAAPR
jgi:hypothetical protein